MESMLDSLVQLGLGGGALALLGWFLRSMLKTFAPVVSKHIETMDAFQRTQALIVATMEQHAIQADDRRRQTAEEHTAIMDKVERLFQHQTKHLGGM